MGFKELKIIMGKILFKKNSMMVILVLLVLSFAGCKPSENEIPEHERLTGHQPQEPKILQECLTMQQAIMM